MKIFFIKNNKKIIIKEIDINSPLLNFRLSFSKNNEIKGISIELLKNMFKIGTNIPIDNMSKKLAKNIKKNNTDNLFL